MPQFKKYKLGEVAVIIDSLHKTPKYSDQGFPMVRATEIQGGALKLDTALKVSSEVFEEFSKNHKPSEGDLVMSRVGTYHGVISYVQKGQIFCLGQNTLFIVPKVHSKFLYYSLITPDSKEQIESLGTGSSQKTISLKSIKEIEILVPNAVSQEKIASILSSLDDKIELNRRTNYTLEQITQTLFKKYFVDDIDPDNLPEGWRWGKIEEIYKTTSGGTPSRAKPEYYENGDIRWVKSKELDGGFILDTEEKITKDALKNSSAKLLPVHSVLVAMYGATVGEIATLSIEATCNQAICAILPNGNYPYSFIFQFLKLNKEDLINKASGSAQQNISQLVIQNFELIIPPSDLVNSFHEVVGNLSLKIESNLKENNYLIQTRDSLLPKLMSGEIELNSIEKELVNE